MLEAREILSFRIMFKCESRISIVVPILLMWFVAYVIQPVICFTSYTALNLIKPHLNCDSLLSDCLVVNHLLLALVDVLNKGQTLLFANSSGRGAISKGIVGWKNSAEDSFEEHFPKWGV